MEAAKSVTIKHPTCIDLFCGAGGFSLGMIMAGWHVVAALDASIECIHTYYYNLCDEDTKLTGEFTRKDHEALDSVRKEWAHFDPITMICRRRSSKSGWTAAANSE